MPCPCYLTCLTLSSVRHAVSHTALRDMATHKKSKVNLSISEKLALLERVKNGERRLKIIDEKGIGMRTIEQWIEKENQVQKKAES